MTTMIALVGEQPQPNFLPVLHDKPSDVVFVYTARTQAKYENLKIALEKLECHIHGIETDPYDIAAIAVALSEWLAKMTKLSSRPMVFNLTGGTKTMSLAAYQVAAQRNAPIIYFQSEGGQSIVYRYNWQDHRLCYQRREELSEYLSLCDMLNLHLGQGKGDTRENMWGEKGPNVRSDGGHLFERAIAQALRDYRYEVMCGVKDKKNQIDVDVMIRHQNQIGIIEAKTAKDSKVDNLDGVKQLSTAMNYLRGTYIQPFLVINGPPSPNLQTTCGILHIPIIILPYYSQGTVSLSQEDSETLLTEIDKVMKVAKSKS